MKCSKEVFHRHARKEKSPASEPQEEWVIAGNSTLNIIIKQKYFSLSENQTYYQCSK